MPRSVGTGILAFRGFLLSPRDRCCGLAVQSHLYPHPSLPLPRLRFDDRVRLKVQADQRYAERGRSKGRLLPATLAAEEGGGGYVHDSEDGFVRGRLGNGGEASDAEAEEFVFGARSSLSATGEGVGSDGWERIS